MHRTDYFIAATACSLAVIIATLLGHGLEALPEVLVVYAYLHMATARGE